MHYEIERYPKLIKIVIAFLYLSCDVCILCGFLSKLDLMLLFIFASLIAFYRVDELFDV